jgi:hypothetical protein
MRPREKIGQLPRGKGKRGLENVRGRRRRRTSRRRERIV